MSDLVIEEELGAEAQVSMEPGGRLQVTTCELTIYITG